MTEPSFLDVFTVIGTIVTFISSLLIFLASLNGDTADEMAAAGTQGVALGFALAFPLVADIFIRGA
jgi:small-conductance mechanosensitive channel